MLRRKYLSYIMKEAKESDQFCETAVGNAVFLENDKGILYRVQGNESGTNYRVVVPKELVPMLLEQYHSTPFSGHQGVKRTLALLERKYWWSTMRPDVENFITTCDKCARRKGVPNLLAPMGNPPEATEFLEILAVDYVGLYLCQNLAINIS